VQAHQEQHHRAGDLHDRERRDGSRDDRRDPDGRGERPRQHACRVAEGRRERRPATAAQRASDDQRRRDPGGQRQGDGDGKETYERAHL
jgi:hypothetical protein